MGHNYDIKGDKDDCHEHNSHGHKCNVEFTNPTLYLSDKYRIQRMISNLFFQILQLHYIQVYTDSRDEAIQYGLFVL